MLLLTLLLLSNSHTQLMGLTVIQTPTFHLFVNIHVCVHA